MLLSWLPLALGAHSLAALILGVLLLDLAGQAIHVLNQSLVFAIDPRAHSRLVGCYMLFYAAGSGPAPAPAPPCTPGPAGTR